MPQDRVQIGLEHHRAGRLVQAEENYRAAILADPLDPEANHWLGVLLSQAGQYADAAPHLELAATRQPDDAAYAHNLGLALLTIGRLEDAIAALQRAAVLDPKSERIATLLAQAYVRRGKENDAAAAIAALQNAVAAGNQSPELRHNLGVMLLRAGKAQEAVAALQAAIAARPQYASAHFHLAAAYRALKQTKDVRGELLKAVEIEPGHAAAWNALATLDAEAGNLDVAASLYRRAIRADSKLAAAHRGLADLLARQGRPSESAAAFSRAQDIAIDRAAAKALRASSGMSVAELQKRITPDEYGEQVYQALAGLLHLPPPLQIAPDEVANLFDRYADRFDAHLQGKLQYRAPEAIAGAVKPHLPNQPVDVLDLGCGTGLCGPLLRPFARSLSGVDLSEAMIEKARARGVYDRLEVGELVQVMKTAPASADLLVAADVLIYIGDLASTFEAAVETLRPGGLFAMTLEATDAERFHLDLATRRYSHSEKYVRRLASIYGFEGLSFQPTVLRMNNLQPVHGSVVVLRLKS